MSKDKLYLIHILECIEKIEDYTNEGKDFFEEDSKTQDAVLRNLQTLSESSMRISEELQLQYSTVPWREIHAFRNVVVHDYLGVELDQIWDIIMIDLLELKVSVVKSLKNSNSYLLKPPPTLSRREKLSACCYACFTAYSKSRGCYK
jgi:uncharacterized protein with HEPN domain